MTSLLWWKTLFEYLGGEKDAHPLISLGSPIWGIWWCLLACIIWAFCGQASKFIYIDF